MVIPYTSGNLGWPGGPPLVWCRERVFHVSVDNLLVQTWNFPACNSLEFPLKKKSIWTVLASRVFCVRERNDFWSPVFGALLDRLCPCLSSVNSVRCKIDKDTLGKGRQVIHWVLPLPVGFGLTAGNVHPVPLPPTATRPKDCPVAW